jgi:cytochrome c-type biogenesis protein CcmH
MTTRFLVIAAIMVVAALACVLVPLLRSARREGRPRGPFVLALVLALVTPPVVLGAYLAVGTPQALQPLPAAENQATLAEAARELQASLQRKPDDARGWALLAQAYSALGQPQQALEALDHLLKLKPDDPDAMVAWVEATAETSPSHRIDDASRAKLQRALQIEPEHQRALWLLGISDFQRNDYAGAAKQWKTLLPLLDPGSRVAETVKQQLAEAETRAGGTATTEVAQANPAPESPASAATSAVVLDVTVKLDPALAAKVHPADTLFVFARAVDGPPMPLAVARLKASELPATVTLTDAMAMTPAMTLSKFPKVSVAARISKSGNAMPQAGDLESAPVEVATDSHAPVALTIDKVD